MFKEINTSDGENRTKRHTNTFCVRNAQLGMLNLAVHTAIVT
jgi:hypothetical protein